MTLLDCLAGLALGRPERQQAARELSQWLGARVRGGLRNRLAGLVVRIPGPPAGEDGLSAGQEDAVQQVLLKVVLMVQQKRFPPLADDAHAAAYLTTMLANYWLSVVRREGRELPSERVADSPVETETDDAGRRVREALERAIEHACALARSDRRENLRAAWQDALALCVGELPAPAEDARRDDEDGWRRARNRRYQEQRRLRLSLGDAIDDLVAREELSAQDGADARWFVTHALVRRKCRT